MRWIELGLLDQHSGSGSTGRGDDSSVDYAGDHHRLVPHFIGHFCIDEHHGRCEPIQQRYDGHLYDGADRRQFDESLEPQERRGL
jgi:hypothetical protein